MSGSCCPFETVKAHRVDVGWSVMFAVPRTVFVLWGHNDLCRWLELFFYRVLPFVLSGDVELVFCWHVGRISVLWCRWFDLWSGLDCYVVFPSSCCGNFPCREGCSRSGSFPGLPGRSCYRSVDALSLRCHIVGLGSDRPSCPSIGVDWRLSVLCGWAT